MTKFSSYRLTKAKRKQKTVREFVAGVDTCRVDCDDCEDDGVCDLWRDVAEKAHALMNSVDAVVAEAERLSPRGK